MDDLYARLKPPAPALADVDRAALRRSLFGSTATARPAPTRGTTTVRLTPGSPGHRPRAIVGAAAAAIGVLGIAGLLAVDRGDDRVTPSAGSPPATDAPAATARPVWQPPGEEFAITDLGPATESQGGPVVEALTRRVGVPGYADRTLAPSLTYSGGTTAELQDCVWSERGGQCLPEWSPTWWSTSDDGDAARGLFTFGGLPPGTAVVGYADGETAYWQRPVRGFAAFPNLPGRAEVVTAWDAGGTVITTVDLATYAGVTVQPPDGVGLSPGAINELNQLTWSSMRTCLSARGGEVGGTFSVADFPDDVDQTAVWDECVAEVKAIVARRVDELT
jgi:hypothetical protein